MKSAACFASLILLLLAPATAQEREDLVPDSLMNWLRIIETEGYSVVYATDDDGEYTAISVDSDGDLLIANHSRDPKGKDVDRGKSGEEWGMHIVDLRSGEDLWDDKAKKQGPDSAKVSYTRSSGIFTSSITNSYPRGVLYPLKAYEGRKVRYEVFRHVRLEKETKLSVVLTLPERKTIR